MARKPTYINPPNRLKEKVGQGGISDHLIDRGQRYLDNNPIDFTPHAALFLQDLKTYTGTIKINQPPEPTIHELSKNVMQLKANGSMFHYQLVSMISDVLLKFLEKVKQIDADLLDILKVYIHILKVVTDKKLTGNGGNEGYILTEELHHACERYNKKYNIL